MDDAAYIRMDRVPADILNQLIKLIEPNPPLPPATPTTTAAISFTSSSSSSSSLPSSQTSCCSSGKDGDETDDLGGSPGKASAASVHVAVTSQPHGTMTSQPHSDSDVVSVFGNEWTSPPGKRGAGGRQRRGKAQPDSDVVSVFSPRPPQDVHHQEQGPPLRPAFSSQLSQCPPTPSSSSNSPPTPRAVPSTASPSPGSSKSLQYCAVSLLTQSEPCAGPAGSGLVDQGSNPAGRSLSCVEGTEDARRFALCRSPPRTPVKGEGGIVRPMPITPSKHSNFPSSVDLAHTTLTLTTSSPQSSSRSRSPPSQQGCSEDVDDADDGDVTRVFPQRSVTPGTAMAGGQRSPRMLTPPETPDNDGPRIVPEVFTFDDLACTQERFRQNCERLSQLQEQVTPTKRGPSTPRHPPLSPSTSSFRRQDFPRSPMHAAARRISPVDPRLLHCFEAGSGSVSGSPQKKEVPGSPKTPKQQTTPQRLAVDDVSPQQQQQQQRRESLSPSVTKKRLDFDDDSSSGGSVSTQHLLAVQRARAYDVMGQAAYGRTSGSGSEVGLFAYPSGYPMDSGQFADRRAASASGKLADYQERLASLAAFQDSRAPDDDDGDDRGGLFLQGPRSLYELDLHSRWAMHNARYSVKRKRQDTDEEDCAQCTCVVMERNFLSMAEGAYKRIRRFDSSPSDFERFHNELMQTNEILRESMGLIKHIRDICDHRKRPRW